MLLGDGLVGTTIRSLWCLGQYKCDQKTIINAMALFNRQQRQELKQSAYLMPTWLADRIFA